MKLLTIAAAALLFASFAVTHTVAQKKSIDPLVGNWICEETGTKVTVRDDGTLSIDGAEYVYKAKNSVITVAGDEGAMTIPYQLSGDTLTVEVDGREMVYTRVKAGPKTSAGANRAAPSASANAAPALVGKWCYMSNLTGSNSRMSNRCFVLNANGTYEYSSETSSSGAYGGSGSQEYDSGRWTATRTTLTAMSASNGKTVYPIELRNHPKTGDPMIIVDGDAYVTAYQRRPW